MAKTNKQELAQALMYLYQSTLDFNKIGGKTISPEYAESQEGLILEEGVEAIVAKLRKDRKEYLDGILDSLVVSSFRVMIAEGNDLITKEHTNIFNPDNHSENVLVGMLTTALLNEDWLGVMEISEDLLYLTDNNAIYNIYQVADSNMSKVVPVSQLDDPEEMCETIESEGRYTGVEYSVTTKSNGEEVYVFTATYDVKEKRAFDKPKIVKPTGFFKEPQLLV